MRYLRALQRSIRLFFQSILGPHILLNIIDSHLSANVFWKNIKARIAGLLFGNIRINRSRKKINPRNTRKKILKINNIEDKLHYFMRNNDQTMLWSGVRDLEAIGHSFSANKRLDLAEYCLSVVAKFRPPFTPAGIDNLRHLGITQFMLGYVERAKKTCEQIGYIQNLAWAQPRVSPNYRILGKSWFVAIGHVAMIDILLKKRELGYCGDVKQFIVIEDVRSGVGKVIFDGFLAHGVNPIWPESLSSFCSPKRLSQDVSVDVTPDWDQLRPEEQENMTQEFWDYNFPGENGGLFYAHAAAKIQSEWESTNRPPLLTLNQEQLTGIASTLKLLGIPENAWYVCLHVRESGFHGKWNRMYPSARDANIDDYHLAINEIVKRGGWVIRMGDASMKLIKPMQGVVDYVHTVLRSEKLDTFLAAGSRFMLGTNSGFSIIPATYGVPCVLTNWIPIALPNWYGIDLMIPKLMRNKMTGKLLNFNEMFDEPLGAIQNVFDFPEAIEIIENTPEEIRAVTVEMLDRLEGKPYTAEDNALQDQYFELAISKGSYRGSRLGRDFLEQYKIILLK